MRWAQPRGLLMRRWMLAGLALTLLGCATAERPTPAPLDASPARLSLSRGWMYKLGLPVAGLSVAVLPDQFVLASRDGLVVSLDAASGAERSRTVLGRRLSAGVGSDGVHAAVVTEGNELVVLRGGRELWRVLLPAASVTAPLVAGERVFALTVDRTVLAFDALDGRALWTYRRSGDALALRHPGVLLARQDTLVVGLGSRLVALDPLQGTVRQDIVVADPRGTNEVERLADVVGPAAQRGSSACVRAFQSTVSCVDIDRGTLVWGRSQSGFQGVAGDGEAVYGADSSDRITAWRRTAGEQLWSTERLRHRQLSAPVALPAGVVFGDYQGWLHVLSRDKGEPLVRLPTDGSAIVALTRSGTQLLAVTRDGNVYTYRPR